MNGRLRDLIAERSLMRGGNFTLASGGSSAHFFDMKMTMLDPEGVNLVAEAFLERIADDPAGHVGGVAMGAVPVVAVVCALSRGTARPRRAFFVRKETKDHGTARQIEGYVPEGGEALLFEDVTSTGGSALAAIGALRRAGVAVRTLHTIVDRLEGARDRLAAEGIRLEALFTARDFDTD